MSLPVQILLLAALGAYAAVFDDGHLSSDSQSLSFHTVAAIAASGPWYAAPPVEDAAVMSAKSASADKKFHGSFRDLSLWAKRQELPAQASGDLDLWVIEFDDSELMAAEKKRALDAGLKVVIVEKLTLVVQGPALAKLGYDGCGGEKDKTVISVSSDEVIIKKMPSSDKTKFMAMAKQKDSRLAGLNARVSQQNMKEVLSTLENYNSRNSRSRDLIKAADWAATKFTEYGFDVARDQYRKGYPANVVAELQGTETPNRIVVLGAHLDSRSTNIFSTTQRAPGADDNGSGSTGILEFARIVKESGIKFKSTLALCLFTGEEQGLLGSRALAKRWKSEGVDVVGMVNLDMIGYKRPNAPITLTLMARSADRDLNEIMMAVASTYLPGVAKTTTRGCCSDQQSFHEQGMPATGIFETPSMAYPHYHKSSDKMQYLNLEQIQTHTTLAVATVAILAEISGPASPAPTMAPPLPTRPPTRRRSARRRQFKPPASTTAPPLPTKPPTTAPPLPTRPPTTTPPRPTRPPTPTVPTQPPTKPPMQRRRSARRRRSDNPPCDDCDALLKRLEGMEKMQAAMQEQLKRLAELLEGGGGAPDPPTAPPPAPPPAPAPPPGPTKSTIKACKGKGEKSSCEYTAATGEQRKGLCFDNGCGPLTPLWCRLGQPFTGPKIQKACVGKTVSEECCYYGATGACVVDPGRPALFCQTR